MKNNRISLSGLLSVAFYLGMFAGAYHYDLQSIHQSAANSGEGGIVLMLYALPWVMLHPSLLTLFGGIIYNAILIYLVMGGALAAFKKTRPQPGAVPDANSGRR